MGKRIFKISFDNYKRLRDDLVLYIANNVYKTKAGQKLSQSIVDINFIKIINGLVGKIKNKEIRQLKNLWLEHRYNDLCKLITAYSYYNSDKTLLLEYEEGTKCLIYPGKNKDLDIVKRMIYTEPEIDRLSL